MKTLGTMVFMIFLALIEAYVLTFFWLWFIVPFGLMKLSVSHAYGLMLIIGIITAKVNMKKETELLEVILNTTIKVAFIVIISFPLGYVVNQIMIGN